MGVAASPDDQFAKINRPEFLDALKERSRTVLAALATVGATAAGLAFAVDEVPVTLKLEGGDVFVTVGENERDPAKPHLYEWRAPAGWLAEKGS